MLKFSSTKNSISDGQKKFERSDSSKKPCKLNTSKFQIENRRESKNSTNALDQENTNEDSTTSLGTSSPKIKFNSNAKEKSVSSTDQRVALDEQTEPDHRPLADCVPTNRGSYTLSVTNNCDKETPIERDNSCDPSKVGTQRVCPIFERLFLCIF